VCVCGLSLSLSSSLLSLVSLSLNKKLLAGLSAATTAELDGEKYCWLLLLLIVRSLNYFKLFVGLNEFSKFATGDLNVFN
jgi:hypothetical protein